MLPTLIISTSSRKNSNSLRVARYLQQLCQQENATTQIVDFENYDIPNVGRGSIQKEKLTTFQAELIEKWHKAQVIIWVLPEYNWSTNAEVINLFHQIASKDFSYLLDNKIFALVGVSAGRGGRIPCLDITTVLNKVISFSNKFSVISPRLLESHETDQNLDEQGNSLGNSLYETTAQSFVKYTYTLAQKWNFEEVLA
ncbi:MAG: NAD(P)H-dependent oxidoreductase [Microscillaceae bacterium]|nr:NAD(P)H-dependent oxidoreductase [Microscillaceae bacterium]MDW8461520.1 NAD(P)H-dependent oxidoreductase [Cytophagales bacterium]